MLERRLLTYRVSIGNPPAAPNGDDADPPQLADVLRSLAESRGVDDVNIAAVGQGTVEVRTTASPDEVNRVLVGDRKLSWLPVTAEKPVSGGGCDVTPTAARQCGIDGETVYSLAKAPFDVTVTAVRGVQSPQPAAEITFDDATGALIAQYTQDNVGKTVALSDGSVVISAAVINAPIGGGTLQLSGLSTVQRQQEMIALLTLAAWQVDLSPS